MSQQEWESLQCDFFMGVIVMILMMSMITVCRRACNVTFIYRGDCDDNDGYDYPGSVSLNSSLWVIESLRYFYIGTIGMLMTIVYDSSTRV